MPIMFREIPDAVVGFLKENRIRFRSVVDLGCGADKNGAKELGGAKFLYVFQEQFPQLKNIEGCDIDCGKPVTDEGVKFSYCDMVKKVPYKSKSFDMVLLTQRLCGLETEEEKQSIKHALRICKKYILIVDFDEDIDRYRGYLPTTKIIIKKSLADFKSCWPGTTHKKTATMLLLAI